MNVDNACVAPSMLYSTARSELPEQLGCSTTISRLQCNVSHRLTSHRLIHPSIHESLRQYHANSTLRTHTTSSTDPTNRPFDDTDDHSTAPNTADERVEPSQASTPPLMGSRLELQMARPEEGRPEHDMATGLHSAGLSRTYGGRIYRNLPSPQSLRDGSDAQPDFYGSRGNAYEEVLAGSSRAPALPVPGYSSSEPYVTSYSSRENALGPRASYSNTTSTSTATFTSSSAAAAAAFSSQPTSTSTSILVAASSPSSSDLLVRIRSPDIFTLIVLVLAARNGLAVIMMYRIGDSSQPLLTRTSLRPPPLSTILTSIVAIPTPSASRYALTRHVVCTDYKLPCFGASTIVRRKWNAGGGSDALLKGVALLMVLLAAIAATVNVDATSLVIASSPLSNITPPSTRC
ncbi:hypothetical protein BJ912DRAFT_1144272 [Pholiota molesta]|nr:hypothetical protein BJ912DRAFT_1144272 [Pholiota molesta]